MLEGQLEITIRKEKFGDNGTVEIFHIDGEGKEKFPMLEFITLLYYLGELGVKIPNKILIIDKDKVN